MADEEAEPSGAVEEVTTGVVSHQTRDGTGGETIERSWKDVANAVQAAGPYVLGAAAVATGIITTRVNAGAQRDVARIQADAHRDVANIDADARCDVAQIQADAQRDVALMQAFAQVEAARIAAEAQVATARIERGESIEGGGAHSTKE